MLNLRRSFEVHVVLHKDRRRIGADRVEMCLELLQFFLDLVGQQPVRLRTPVVEIGTKPVPPGCSAASARRPKALHLRTSQTTGINIYNHQASVIFVNENENGAKRKNNEFVNKN